MHKGQAGSWIVQGFELLDLVHGPDGVVNAWPLALDHIKLNTEGWQGGQDVTEKDDTCGVCVGGGDMGQTRSQQHVGREPGSKQMQQAHD